MWYDGAVNEASQRCSVLPNAKLARKGGADLEQIQLNLGHALGLSVRCYVRQWSAGGSKAGETTDTSNLPTDA